MAQNNGGVGTTTQDLLISINEKIGSISRMPRDALQSAIYLVPAHFREGNESCYKPRSVSIGPYHHGHEKLSMASIKTQYLRDFLERNPSRDLQSYISELKKLETKARNHYINFDAIDVMSSDDFTEMLLFDGCFVLECALKRYENKFDRIGPISRAVISDLLLLENQLPFFVLVTLYDALNLPAANKPSLVYILASYLNPETSADRYVSRFSSLTISVDEVYHLLHLYHICFVGGVESNQKFITCLVRPFSKSEMTTTSLPTDNDTARFNTADGRPLIKRIPCASELVESGIMFRRTTAGSLDVSFRNGVLSFPYLSIRESTRSSFMNLLAFEKISGGSKFTSYVIFMDSLIDTAKDVKLLQQSGVIDNNLWTEKETALLFDKLSSYCHLDLEQNWLADVYEEVDKYYQSKLWRMNTMRVYRDYFGRSWSMLSFLASVVLLALTFTQTYFAILAYNPSQPPPNA